MKIAIKGHESRGKEVIQILESLGGRNTFNYNGDFIRTAYFIGMDYSIYGFCTDSPKVGFKVYTLEEFETQFPFKVGDKVVALADNKPHKIIALENYNNNMCYKLDDSFHYTPQTLKPYKEMKEERNITLTLDKAKEWYKKGGDLKQVALQIFTEEELTKVDLPKTWEEFYKQYDFKPILNDCLSAVSNTFSMKYVNKFEAFVKLQYLRDCWRQGSVPQGVKYKIRKVKNKYTIVYGAEDAFLSFCDNQTAEEFLKCFRDLIEQAGDLI